MTKQTGIALTTLSVDDAAGNPVDIRASVTNWDLAFPRGVQDATGQNGAAMDRLLLLADSSFNATGVVDSATSHLVFKTVSTTSVSRTVAIDAGTPDVSNEYLFTDYTWTRAQDGSLVWAAPGVLTGGYVRRKTFSLYFTDEDFEGLAIEARSGTLQEFVDVGSLLEKEADGIEESHANVKAAHDIVFPKLQQWNLQEEDGTPVPLTREAFDGQDRQLVEGIVLAWRKMVAGVRPALKEKSNSGAPSVGVSIPMETLSENL